MALSDLPLVQSTDLTYSGKFSISSAFQYGGSTLYYNPAGNSGAGSLYVGGHDAQPISLGEVSVPALDGTATTIQAPTAIPNESTVDTTASALIHNGRLIVSGYEYYDGSEDQTVSHWRSTDTSIENLQGPFRVGTMNPGYYGGWMGDIPEAWQAALGGPCYTGLASVAILTRTSYGPSLFAFDPDDVGVVDPAPVVPLLYYTGTHALGDGPSTSPAVVWNAKSLFAGPIIPKGSRSILFFCRFGKGQLCYGTGQNTDPDQHCEEVSEGHNSTYDPMSIDQGYHAWPYAHAVLAYDLLDLAAVKAGTKQPWEPYPYGIWMLPDVMAFESSPEGMCNMGIGSIAHDPATRTFYISNAESFGNFGPGPKMHVWTYMDFGDDPGPDPDPEPSTAATALGAVGLLPLL